jgi:putative flavoprotein involved in K+ transport
MSYDDRGSGTTRGSAGLIEEGSAFLALSDHPPERFDVVVIGAGQAGLAVGYHLARAGLRFVIVDGNARIGDSWRKRWDSLRLFTPAKFDGLVGMPFPAPPDTFPTKDQMADYLEAYAARFQLPVRTSTRVERLCRRGTRYLIKTSAGELQADQVVIAMANYQQHKLPPFAAELAPGIVQLRSSDYRNLRQLQPGGVLLAGAGNSGSELALEVARGGHPTWMAGRDTGHLPFRIASFLGRKFLARMLLRFVFHRLLTIRSPLGRLARPKILGHGGPLIRVQPKDLAAIGVQRVGRVVGVQEGKPLLEDGRVLDVANVIWTNGYHPGFSWIDLGDLDLLDERGEPRHVGGTVPGAPGLYFVGLGFLYSMSSSMIHGVSRDAGRIAKALIALRASEARASMAA